MIATFNDLQDRQNSLNGSSLRSERELQELLQSLEDRQPFFFELVSENGFTLLVGYGRNVGCVQHSTSDGEPPYLMALSDDTMEDEPFVNFLTGNTPTPIPQRYCLPMDKVRRIIGDFLVNGTRSEVVGWAAI